ncbi:glycosyltransferase family 2 protein [Mycobacterium sp. SMC-4]|uniref:glycosyltransferase family 2 protein n=1 Tax=Mycobacterium sp. SMC-4 TaxID=2857059 RepID=UPI003D08CEAD
MTAPRFGIAIATIGRWAEVGQLLDDLAAQTYPPSAVVIAHHDREQPEPEALTALLRTRHLPVRVVVSPRGVSHARNIAAAALGDDVDWVLFPNDTTRYDADFLERLAGRCVPPTTVCAAQLVDQEGPRNLLPAAGAPLTRRTAWGAIEPATAFRLDEFRAVGGFDVSIGTGSDSPWQAGEGTDLVLRLAERDGFSIEWASDIVVHAATEFAHLRPEERRRKLRNYGRGAGHLLRKWRYPLWYKLAHLLAAALMPLRNRKKFTPADGLALLTGRTEGVLGRTFSREEDHRAVVR